MEENANQTVNIKLSGMTCANCALKIETKLRGMNGVSSSVVNFANEEATVEYNPNTTNYNDFNKAIKDLGYKASLEKIDIRVVEDLSEEKFNDLFENFEIELLENNIAYDVVHGIRDKLHVDIVGKSLKRTALEELFKKDVRVVIKDIFDSAEEIDLEALQFF